MKRIYCNEIHALSSRIAMLIQENEYTEDDQILLTYGVEIWMEEIVKTGALLLGGLLIGRIKEIAVAILSFCSMRKVAGGYHADSSIKCFMFSSSFILGSAYAPQIISKYPIWVFGIIPVFYGFFSPSFIHEELNTLTQKRKCMILLLILLGIAFIIPAYWQAIILTGIVFEGFTLLKRKELVKCQLKKKWNTHLKSVY